MLEEKMQKRANTRDELEVDFEEQVSYDSFRKIVDYLYLDDL